MKVRFLLFAFVAISGLAVNAVRAADYTIFTDDFNRSGSLDASTTTTGSGTWSATPTGAPMAA